MPKPLRVRRANEIVGLFILLALAIALAAVFLGPQTQRWFTPTRTLAVHLPPEGSLGLRRGGDVQILGSVVGTVDDIIVTEEGGMEATVSIQGNFIRFVRMDSRAIIRKPLGIGDASIEITRGHGDPLPPVGASLQSVADKAPTEMVEETLAIIRDEALPTIKELRGAVSEFTKLAAELRGQQAGIAQVLQHVNRVGADLQQGKGLAAMLISDPRPAAELRAALPKLNSALDELQGTLHGARALAERLPRVGADMEEVMRNSRLASAEARVLAERLPRIGADMEEMMKNSRLASAEARRLATALPELEKSARRAVDAVPGMLLQSQETLYQIQRLTEGVQRSWLVRGNMEPVPSGGRLSSDRVGTDR